MAKRGRKKRLNQEVIEYVSKAIELGVHKKAAAQAVGISEQSFYKWLREGEEAVNKGLKNIYAKFYNAVKEAEAKAIIRHLSNIVKASNEGSWQASAWILERRFPELWGRKDFHDVNASGQVVVKIVDAWDEGQDGNGEDDSENSEVLNE